MKLAKYVMKKQNNVQFQKNFVDFQEKHLGEIAFLNKVTSYLTLTGNVLLGNL